MSTSQGTVNVRRGQQSLRVTEGNTSYVGKNQKSPLQASPSPPEIRKMWQSIRTESWSQPGSVARGLKLNREAEVQINSSMRRPQKKKVEPRTRPKRKG